MFWEVYARANIDMFAPGIVVLHCQLLCMAVENTVSHRLSLRKVVACRFVLAIIYDEVFDVPFFLAVCNTLIGIWRETHGVRELFEAFNGLTSSWKLFSYIARRGIIAPRCYTMPTHVHGGPLVAHSIWITIRSDCEANAYIYILHRYVRVERDRQGTSLSFGSNIVQP